MKSFLVVLMFGIVGFGVCSQARAEEPVHTKEYEQWRKNTIDELKLASKCMEVDRNIKKIVRDTKVMYPGYDDKGSMLGYIVWLRSKFVISYRDADLSQLKMENIPEVMNSNVPALDWLITELIEAFKPLEDLAHMESLPSDAREVISRMKMKNMEYLHFSFLMLNGIDPRMALVDADEFQKKLLNR